MSEPHIAGPFSVRADPQPTSTGSTMEAYRLEGPGGVDLLACGQDGRERLLKKAEEFERVFQAGRMHHAVELQLQTG